MKIKFNILAIVLLVMPMLAFAQQPAQKPYETITPEDKLLADYGKKYPGYYVTKDGNQTDCLILFEEGDKINNPDVKLTTALSYQGEVTLVDKSTLKAFYVNKRLYKPMMVIDKDRWVYVTTQGAIQVIKNADFREKSVNTKLEFWYDKENATNVGYWDTLGVIMPYWTEAEFVKKLDNAAEAVFAFNRKNMLRFVGDYEELGSKIQNKEQGYKNSLIDLDYKDRMFGIYNKWYDEQNPGVVERFPEATTFVAPDKPQSTTAPVAVAVVEEKPVASNYEKEMMAAAEKAHRAPRINVFKGRPTTANASIASAKPEVAVKKQSFKDRLARIKADGNKVGVLVTGTNLFINPNDYGEGIRKARVMGSYGPLQGLDKLADATTKSLNDGFGIDVFETVDYAQIPVKNGKYGKMDDWWSTKYKIIILYEVKPWYEAYYKFNSEADENDYIAKMHVDAKMIVMSAEEAKPDKLKYVTSSSRTWSYYNSDKFIGPADTNFDIIQDLKAAIDPPSDAEVIEELISNQEAAVAKFIKKKSK